MAPRFAQLPYLAHPCSKGTEDLLELLQNIPNVSESSVHAVGRELSTVNVNHLRASIAIDSISRRHLLA